jgi:hypothetical protein
MMECKVCGVRTAHDWTNGTCIHCDWFLGEGYTKEEIRTKMIKQTIKNNHDALKRLTD